MGRHTRGRGQWEEEMARVEEIESEEEEDDYGRHLARNGRARMRQLEYGGRGPRRRTDFEDLTDGTESGDGGDYDLYDHQDSTVAYAVQLAMRDKEDQLVEKALERIRRAQMLGKKNVRLSQRELNALERKRRQTDDPSEALRLGQAKNATNTRPSARRTDGPLPEPSSSSSSSGRYPPTGPETGWNRGTGTASGRPWSSSSAHRPRTPTMQSLRPQQSNSPLRPTYPPFPERLPPNGRPQSMHHPMYARPLPDDPQWAPPYYNLMPLNPYQPEQPSYLPQLPNDLRIGPQSRMSYPAGMSPIQGQPRHSFDGRQATGPSHQRGARQPPSESESESSSDEDEETEESSEDEEDEEEEEVQIVRVVERQNAPGLQRRTISGGSRGRPRRSR